MTYYSLLSMVGVVVAQPPATDPTTPATSPDMPTGETPIQEQTEPPPGCGSIAAIFGAIIVISVIIIIVLVVTVIVLIVLMR